MTCRRVVIIDRGKIIAQDTAEVLTAKLEGSEQSQVTVAGPREAVMSALQGLPQINRLEDRTLDGGMNGTCSFIAFAQNGEAARSAIAAAIVEHGWGLLEIKPVALSLEDLFMRLVTRESDEKMRAQ